MSLLLRSRAKRPESAELVDLHVYLVPHNLWRERYNNFLNANVTETVSAGIIRVHPEQKVILLRNEIDKQIGAELVPREYVFLKSVGRSITKLNGNQEYQLKVKNFIPPQSYAPELFLLEAQDVDSSRSSVRPESPEYATGRKSDRTPYTSHNTNPTSPEYNVSSAENLTSRHPAGVKNNYPSPFHHSPIPKIPQKNNPDPRRYESMDPDSHSTPDDVINNYPRAQPYQTPPRGQRAQSPPPRGDRNDITPPRRQDRGANRGHDPASGRDSDTPTDVHQPDQINAQRSQSPSRVVNRRSQSPERIVDRKSPPRYTNEKVRPQDKPNEQLARIDDDNVATPPKHSERPREIPTKIEQNKSPIREAEKPQAKQGRKVASPVPGKVQTNGTSRPLSASWGSDQDSPSPGGAPPPKQKPQKGAVPGPPLSATPPPLVESSNRPVAAGNKYDSRLETYTNHTNEDSGIAGLTPEDHYRENQDDDLDRRKRENEEKRRREAELRDRLKADQEEREQKEKSGRDKEWERHEQLEEERRRKDEEEKRGREGEKRRQEEADKRRENEEEARREQDRNLDRLSASDEELNRFPSPPPLKMSTPSSSKGPRDSIGGSDTERGQHGKTEKEQLMRELEQAREARKTTEKQREDLVKKAKMLQNKMQNRRNHARDLWKKRYFEEKKRTSPLEEQCNRLRHELEIIHRKLMNTLEGPAKDKATQRVGDLKPSLQSNYKIQAARLMHEIEDIRRRLENAKMKLTAEMKLRNQAETELRAMRAELIQKKINRTLTRHSHYQPSISASDPYLNQTAVSPRS
ncbi:serine/arginine repetitive matrix protein 1-like isoform X2 [Mizuhopecten yessoensis]|uniref:serine/arginine repetitive matrix protein 1-like isoform X2 n=1 Tax=Mizuhopecten yessoensis TaxID=6573 RepID=UPI000B457CF1|nr:serine/arginine repetitive matrix protein 1-like isoform X2 [Mizuhopecten yessoensis]